MQKRLEAANELIKTISSCGRRFFYDDRFQRVAFFFIDKETLYFVDEYTGKKLSLSMPEKKLLKQGFSHGGTMKWLILDLACYIKTGKKLKYSLGPFPNDVCHGDPWGYGEDMEIVKKKAIELGIL